MTTSFARGSIKMEQSDPQLKLNKYSLKEIRKDILEIRSKNILL